MNTDYGEELVGNWKGSPLYSYASYEHAKAYPISLASLGVINIKFLRAYLHYRTDYTMYMIDTCTSSNYYTYLYYDSLNKSLHILSNFSFTTPYLIGAILYYTKG